MLAFLCAHVADGRIVRPDAREELLSLMLHTVQYPPLLEQLEKGDAAQPAQLLRALLGAFGETTWVAVSGVLLRLLNDVRCRPRTEREAPS